MVLLDLLMLRGRQARPDPAVDLRSTHPLAHRLRRPDPDLGSERPDCLKLRRVLRLRRQPRANRQFSELRQILRWAPHDVVPPPQQIQS